MKALMCEAHGSWRDLVIREIDDPVVSPGEVLVDVRAAGLSFATILSISGRHQNHSTPPFVPGTEASGVVAAVGEGVTRVQPGDRVVATLRRGAFAEQALVPSDRVFLLPESIDFDAATSLPTLFATAWVALKVEARLAPGETVLVTGAAGATGNAAVQIATALGARVLACASTEQKRNAARAAGANVGLPAFGFRETVLAETNGRGADIVYDVVGGKVFDEALRSVAPEGRVLPIGFASGEVPHIPANIVLVKNVSVIGINWGYYAGWSPKPPSRRAEQLVTAAFAALHDLAEKGDIAPRVHAIVDFGTFYDGFSAIEDRIAVGKIALRPVGANTCAGNSNHPPH